MRRESSFKQTHHSNYQVDLVAFVCSFANILFSPNILPIGSKFQAESCHLVR